MADARTNYLDMTKPEEGASRNSWGAKLNNDLDTLDSIFDPAGYGRQVGLHIGPEMKLRIAGEVILAPGSVFAGDGIADNSVPPAKVAFSSTNLIVGRKTAGAGKGEEQPCTAIGFDLLASNTKAGARAAIGAASSEPGDTGFTSVDDSAIAGPVIALDRQSPSPADNDALGRLSFLGGNSNIPPAPLEYAAIQANLTDVGPVGSEDGAIDFATMLSGTSRVRFTLKGGFSARGLADLGDGTINATGLFVNGAAVSAPDPSGNASFTSTNAGATAGPVVTLDRNSASPADSDALGRLAFKGRNSANTSTEYAAIAANLIDAGPAGTEDGELSFESILAGTNNVRFALRGGLFARGTADMGDGTVNANALYVNGAAVSPVAANGSVVNFSYVMAGTSDSTAVAIPVDNTIPQSGEGKLFMSLNHNPNSTGNILKVEVVFCYEIVASAGNNTFATAALFLDAATAAVAAATQGTDKNGNQGTIAFTYVMVAPSTSPITFKVRGGPASGSFTLNTGNIFNGKQASSITVTEIKA